MYEITLRYAKKTKNTVKFDEVRRPGQPNIAGSIYIQDFALEALGNPEEIKLTVEAATV